MIRYRNTSVSAKTFYGVTFKPGDEHDVPGYINDPKMVRVSLKSKEPPKASNKKTSASSSTKVVAEELKPSKDYDKEEN